MIIVTGNIITENNSNINYTKNSIEWKIFNALSISEDVYEYTSINQLAFEVNLRDKIIKASRELDASGFKFRTFKKSICNPDYWERTEKGGFLLKDNVSPSKGIKDIFANGSKYGTECSTAIIILYYKAVLAIYPEELFDVTFPKLHLMNWHYIDDDLDIVTYRKLSSYVPGDCRYIENPDFNPEKPEWRGENLIDLGDGTYYGHGIGITTTDNVIHHLNRHRKPDATKSAYLKETATRPNFRHLANVYLNYSLGRMWNQYNQITDFE